MLTGGTMLLYPDNRDQKEELPYCRDLISEFQQLADRGDKFIALSMWQSKKNNEHNSDHHRQRPSQIVLVQKSVRNRRCKYDAKVFWRKNIYTGADLGFSRGEGEADFQKIFENFVDPTFLGRPNWFFGLSQSTVLSLFWPICLRRRQKLKKKQAKKGVFSHFLENFDQKIGFFGARFPLKTSICWHQRPP